MPQETRIVSPGPNERSVTTADGEVLPVPGHWELLPPGDATWTRRVKAAGPSWTVKVKKGRRVFSQGVWAPADHIQQIKKALETERSTEAYAMRRKSDAERRSKKQNQYVEDFEAAIVSFLGFATPHEDLANKLAKAVAAHATPIGSGTVARTQRIPIEKRAESAVIAWLRHKTTGYDNMVIPRVKGKRREVRRQLAQRSRRLLKSYRDGETVDACPLLKALQQGE